MTGFLRSCFQHSLRKEEHLNRFSYSEFDATVLEERMIRHRQSKQERGEPSTSGLKDAKEEPAEEVSLDLENLQYSFYLHPSMDEE
jgi:hypothetical protein